MNKFKYLWILLFVISCNDNNEPLDPGFFIIEPESTQIKIDVKGLDKIDYTNVVAITLDTINTITPDGIFENPYIDNGIEDLPVLLIENKNVLLGYFPHTLESNKPNIDDTLLFYFLIYPELAIQGIDYKVILEKIKSSASYDKMKQLVVSDLNLNKSPLDNDEFSDIIRNLTVEIKKDITSKTSKTNKDGNETFRFTYDRDGKISWLDEVPVYAAVGISIQNKTSGKAILTPKILKNKSLVLSPSSAISWLYNEIFTENNEVKTETLDIKSDGIYNISFSNGTDLGSNTTLKSYVKNTNRRYIGSNMLGLVMPFSIKSLKSNCTNAISKILIEVLTKVDQLLLERKIPDSGETIKILIGISESTVEALTECVSSNGNATLYLKVLGSAAVKNLDRIEDIATLTLLFRDYIGSDISGTETRYFSNGVSFGELKGKDESELEFKGDPESIHTYTKVFEESVVSYDVDRGILSSTFKVDKKWVPAVNLPFVPKVTFGNADVSDNPYDGQGQINTSLEGEISVKMKMGGDVSKIEIKPDFETYLAVDDRLITLIPNNTISLSGNMDFGDVKINESKGELLTIENNTSEVLNITSISLPEGYSHTWETQPIESKESKSFIVVFEPTEVTEYNGTITIANNLDNENNTIPINGNGTDDKITLEGSLDFGNVDINTSTNAMPSKSFYISNYNLNRSINVDPINNLPEGFTATDGWVNGGELGPGAKQEVVITFNPIVAKDYGSTIEVINDLDQINNKIAVTGKGFDSNIKIEGTWFGETIVSKCEPARNDTVTPNCEMHVVLNEREVEFIGGTNLTCTTGNECGLVIFNFYTNSETVLKNKYEFDGTTLTIQMITSSSGSYFNGRTYNYTGTINETGDKIEGNYTMDMPGGIWGAYTEGTMTYTKK